MEHWPNKRYYNFGFWGCNMGSIHDALPTLLDAKKPTTVLIAFNLMDMMEIPGGAIKPEAIAEAKEQSGWWAYAANWNAPYYLRNMELNRIRYTDPANYEYLGLDENGGAVLQVPKDQIDQARYDKPLPAVELISKEQYDALDKIAKLCADRNVKLLLLLSPYREGMVTADANTRIAAHAAKTRTILEKHGHQLLDATDKSWSDALYCDSSHLNGAGAYDFTKYALAKVQ